MSLTNVTVKPLTSAMGECQGQCLQRIYSYGILLPVEVCQL